MGERETRRVAPGAYLVDHRTVAEEDDRAVQQIDVFMVGVALLEQHPALGDGLEPCLFQQLAERVVGQGV